MITLLLAAGVIGGATAAVSSISSLPSSALTSYSSGFSTSTISSSSYRPLLHGEDHHSLQALNMSSLGTMMMMMLNDTSTDDDRRNSTDLVGSSQEIQKDLEEPNPELLPPRPTRQRGDGSSSSSSDSLPNTPSYTPRDNFFKKGEGRLRPTRTRMSSSSEEDERPSKTEKELPKRQESESGGGRYTGEPVSQDMPPKIIPPPYKPKSFNDGGHHFNNWNPWNTGQDFVVHKAWDCWIGGKGLAKQNRLQEQINYLKNKRAGTLCHVDPGPRKCSRVSCTWNAAVWLCNDTDKELDVPCPMVAEFVETLRIMCTAGFEPKWAGVPEDRWLSGQIVNWFTQGQIFNYREGYNVIVGKDKC